MTDAGGKCGSTSCDKNRRKDTGSGVDGGNVNLPGDMPTRGGKKDPQNFEGILPVTCWSPQRFPKGYEKGKKKRVLVR